MVSNLPRGLNSYNRKTNKQWPSSHQLCCIVICSRTSFGQTDDNRVSYNTSTRPNRISNQESNSRNSGGGNYRHHWHQAMVIKKTLVSPGGNSGMTRDSKIGIRHNKISADARDAMRLVEHDYVETKSKNAVGWGYMQRNRQLCAKFNTSRMHHKKTIPFISMNSVSQSQMEKIPRHASLPSPWIHAQFHVRKKIKLNFTHNSTQTS